MGLFWDKLKARFKRKNQPYIEEMAADLNEEFLNEIDNFVSNGGSMTFKRSEVEPKVYRNDLTHRKNISQKRNWKRWKNRI